MLTELLLAGVFLLGGAFIIFVYEAFRATGSKNLLYLSLGFFLMLIGSNLDAVLILFKNTELLPLTFLVEMAGILVILYSALRV